jgi:Zn-dependent protease
MVPSGNLPGWSAQMTVLQSAILLLAINLGLLALLMRLPLGIRTLRLSRTFRCSPETLLSAMHPAGSSGNWHHSVITSLPLASRDGIVEQTYTHFDKNGAPLRRLLALAPLSTVTGTAHGFQSTVIDDSALDPSFWKDFRERRIVRPTPGGAALEIDQTDRYRGLAFLLYRYVALRREMRALEGWLKTGQSRPQGRFEHPLVQFGLAILSTLLLWPFLGLTIQGLMISAVLTLVIALHELGHMAAYRMFGHASVRMIFVPLLGGLAIGGRPYRSLFEVATCALMGAGMSAFLVPIIVVAHQLAENGMLPAASGAPLLVFLLILGAFNLLNLLPMHRFDGGQVLRQIFRTRRSQIAASFLVTLCILLVGFEIGISANMLMVGLLVFTIVSLIGARSVRPRQKLDEMTDPERMLVGFGLYSAIVMHGYAIIFAVGSLF